MGIRIGPTNQKEWQSNHSSSLDTNLPNQASNFLIKLSNTDIHQAPPIRYKRTSTEPERPVPLAVPAMKNRDVVQANIATHSKSTNFGYFESILPGLSSSKPYLSIRKMDIIISQPIVTKYSRLKPFNPKNSRASSRTSDTVFPDCQCS